MRQSKALCAMCARVRGFLRLCGVAIAFLQCRCCDSDFAILRVWVFDQDVASTSAFAPEREWESH
eukprot:10325700-Lingulodinium_polyedra.AAC.1